MSSSALMSLHRFHQELHQAVSDGVKHFSAHATPELSAYSQSFHASLPPNALPESGQRIRQSLESTDLLLFGDFHTLPQSQKTFLRLLEDAVKQARPVTVALEIFAAEDQALIDEFQAGQLPEEYFLKRIDYHNKWGFPWENYRPIVDFCVRNRIPMYGINWHLEPGNRLKKRDAFAAKVLNGIFEQHPQSLCLCLIGEHHLADEHLPSYIHAQHRLTRIVNNVDEYFLKKATDVFTTEEFFTLKENYFCVMNTMPWIKWQSLAMWEELHGTGEHPISEGDPDTYTEHHYDFEYQWLFILRSLNRFLGLELTSHDISKFDIYLQPDRATLNHLKSKLSLPKQAMRLLESRLQKDGYHYLQKTKTLVLSEFSVEPLTEAAGGFLRDCLMPPVSGSTGFIQRLSFHIASTVTGLLLNPRRVYPTIQSVEENCNQLKRKRLLGERKAGREVLRSVLPIYDIVSKTRDVERTLAHASYDEKDWEWDCRISSTLGQVLGHEIFQSLIQQSHETFVRNVRTALGSRLSEQLALRDEAARLLSAS